MHELKVDCLDLPFQFYSYSLAAVNKTVGAMAHGQLKSQFIGVAAAMGLGYMVLQARTPDFVELEWILKISLQGRLIILVLHHCFLIYFIQQWQRALLLGGPNITGGLLKQNIHKNQILLMLLLRFWRRSIYWMLIMQEHLTIYSKATLKNLNVN